MDDSPGHGAETGSSNPPMPPEALNSLDTFVARPGRASARHSAPFVSEGRGEGSEAPIEFAEVPFAQLVPSPGHPAVRSADKIRAALKRDGLPTRADRVVVYVSDPTPLEHGLEVARATVGPSGVGRGSDVRIANSYASYAPDEHLLQLQAAVERGEASIDEVKAFSALEVEHVTREMSASLRSARAYLPSDRTSVFVASWGRGV